MDQRFTLLMLGLFASSSLAAEAEGCDNRITTHAFPKVPASLAATHALRERACSILIRFVLNANGEPSDVKASSIEERCAVFESAAAASIQASTFRPGVGEVVCERTINFKVENDV